MHTGAFADAELAFEEDGAVVVGDTANDVKNTLQCVAMADQL